MLVEPEIWALWTLDGFTGDAGNEMAGQIIEKQRTNFQFLMAKMHWSHNEIEECPGDGSSQVSSHPMTSFLSMTFNLFTAHLGTWKKLQTHSMLVETLGELCPYASLTFLAKLLSICTWLETDVHYWSERLLLLMAEILHHLGCMKPYK